MPLPSEYKTENGGIGLIAIQTPEQVDEQRRKQEQDAQLQMPVPKKELVSHLQKCWQAAKAARESGNNSAYSISDILLRCERQKKGEYSPEKLAEIRKYGGSEVFVRFTATKCLAAEAWIADTLMPADDKPWTIEPTPIPDIPEAEKAIIEEKTAQFIRIVQENSGKPPLDSDIELFKEKMHDEILGKLQEEAKKRCEAMERLIEDQLREGGWHQAFTDCIADICMYPIGCIKGPVFRKKKVIKWQEGQDGWKPLPSEEIVIEFERVAPYNLYPSPKAGSIQKGYLFEKMLLSRMDIASLKGVKGYNDAEIDLVLQELARGELSRWTDLDARERDRMRTEFKSPELTPSGSSDDLTDALEYHGSVQGRMLIEWGMAGIEDPNAEYNIWSILIGNHVIKAELNPDPLGKRPYYITSFEKIADAIWGYGIAQKMEATQESINASRRHLLNNLSIASGPQVSVNTALVSPGEDITSLRPWKIWQYEDKTGNKGKAYDFWQPNSNSQELIAVGQTFKDEADDDTQIPRFEYGNSNLGGAGATARGLSMLMGAASKSIKKVIGNIDFDIIEPVITALYNYNMMYSKDNYVKGDAKVVAKGALALAQKEQTVAMRQEFMRNVLSNEQLIKIVGKKRLLQLLRESTKGLEMPINSIIPSDDQLVQEEAEEEQKIIAMQNQGLMGLISRISDAVAQGKIPQEQAFQIMLTELQNQQQQGNVNQAQM